MSQHIPPITPYLAVSNAHAAIDFYKKALGAEQVGEAHTMPNTDKIMHVRLMVNGALIMLADDLSQIMNMKSETPEALGGSPITLALQVDNVQPLWDRAIAAGGKVIMPLADQFWGDRYGMFVDPFGHKWSMSQTLKQMTDEEMKQAAADMMKSKGALRAALATDGDRGTTRPGTLEV